MRTPHDNPRRASKSTPHATLLGGVLPPGAEPLPEGEAAPELPQALRTTRPLGPRGQMDPPTVPPDWVPVLPGRQIPGTRYKVLRWLGDGGMGVVYEAEHVDLDRKVALKILRPEACQRPDITELFRAEARRVSQLGSRYIVEVLDFGELADGRMLFTMEFLDAETLRDAIETGPMPVARVIGILRQVCKGLAAAHDAGVVHRDVKPENIALARKEGRHDCVKLLDFGISAMLSETRGANAVHAGTPMYLAPELVAALAHDGRADIYALGCTAYEMLTGVVPFDGNAQEIAAQQVIAEPKAFSTRDVPHPIPAAVERVVMRCLEKSPDDRYPDAHELEAALCEAQIEAKLQTDWDDLPLPDVEAERRDRLLRRMPDPRALGTSRRRTTWMVMAAVAMALIVGLGFALLNQPEATPAQRDHIEELSVAARAAAARAFYVYPPPDAPDTETAYQVVQALEQIEGASQADARAKANELRREFAETLVRLGDTYWDRDGGKAFSIDYYASALMFAPGHVHAKDRATLTPGQLAVLKEKADTQTFTPSELEAAEPLAILAEPDEEVRAEKLKELRAKRRPRSATTEAQLATLVPNSEADPRKPAAPALPGMGIAGSIPTEALGDPAADPVADPAADPDAPPTTADPEPQRKPELARRLVTEANAARKAGKTTQARRLYQQALVADSRTAAALAGLARIHFDAGRYAEAAQYGRRAIRIDPRNAQYRVRLGDAYYKSFQFDRARTQYERAKKLGHTGADGRLAKLDARGGAG